MDKVVIALSGGMDSATLCAYYINKNFSVFPISFEYGSKHNKYERQAALLLCDYWNLDLKLISLNFISDLFESNLLLKGGDIPEGHYESKNMSKTVVPGRNVIFASIMMGYAWSIGANTIALGVHAGDHTIYEDCRAGFISAMNAAVISGSGDRVHLEAPFLYMNKTDILKIGYGFGYNFDFSLVPYRLTRTCYKDQELSCGKCGSDIERLIAFHEIGREDPIVYENRDYFKQFLCLKNAKS